MYFESTSFMRVRITKDLLCFPGKQIKHVIFIDRKPTILGATTTAPTTTTTEQPIVRHSDVITVEYEDFDSEEMILRSKSMESNAEPEQPKSPVQNASLMISISVIILLAILFLICFVLRVRRKAKERNREKLHLEQTNGDSKTYVSKEP